MMMSTDAALRDRNDPGWKLTRNDGTAFALLLVSRCWSRHDLNRSFHNAGVLTFALTMLILQHCTSWSGKYTKADGVPGRPMRRWINGEDALGKTASTERG